MDFGGDVLFVQFAISATSTSVFSVIDLCRRAKRAGIGVVVGYHEGAREIDLLGLVSRAIYSAMAGATTTAIAFSAAGEQALRGAGFFTEIVRVPHGTAAIAIASPSQQAAVNKDFGLSVPTVLCLGFTHADKGTDLVIEAAEQISQASSGNVRFLIAGRPRKRKGIFRHMGRADKVFQKHLEKMAAARPNLDIEFRGFIPEDVATELLRQSGVVVLPYRKITQSGIANLALASGAAIVTSDLIGLADELCESGRYFSTGNALELAAQVSEVLADTELNTNLRRAALEKAAATRRARRADDS